MVRQPGESDVTRQIKARTLEAMVTVSLSLVHTHTLMLFTGSTGLSLMSAVTRQQKHVINSSFLYMKPWYDSHTITGTLLCVSLSLVHTHTLMLSTGSTGSLMSAVTRQQKHVINSSFLYMKPWYDSHTITGTLLCVSLSLVHTHTLMLFTGSTGKSNISCRSTSNFCNTSHISWMHGITLPETKDCSIPDTVKESVVTD
ncbi:hypothetical protein CEXT_320301, partial [Caerostris extrusa]